MLSEGLTMLSEGPTILLDRTTMLSDRWPPIYGCHYSTVSCSKVPTTLEYIILTGLPS